VLDIPVVWTCHLVTLDDCIRMCEGFAVVGVTTLQSTTTTVHHTNTILVHYFYGFLDPLLSSQYPLLFSAVRNVSGAAALFAIPAIMC